MIVQENTPKRGPDSKDDPNTGSQEAASGSSQPPLPPPMYSYTAPPVQPYQNTYQPYTPEPYVVQSESTFKRFWKAFGIAVTIWFLFAVFTESMFEVGSYGRSRLGWSGDQAGWPTPADGIVRRCISGSEWSEYIDNPTWSHFPHGAETTFELPVDSDALFFLTRGNWNAGIVKIVNSEIVKDTADVTVRAHFYYQSALDRATLCLLKRGEDEQGVGIFTPRNWYPHGQQDRVQFEVTISLPASSDDEPLRIKSFESDASLYAHEIGDLQKSVYFNAISVRTSNVPISAKSIFADKGKFKSSNAPIKGTFNTSTSLELITSNAPIEVEAGLLNDDASSPTEATFKTSNSPIESSFSLQSEYLTGGAFKVSARTSNGHIDLSHATSPVNSILNLSARTSNAPAFVSLHGAYEGDYTLDTSRLAPTVVKSNTLDPSGRGRRRVVEQTTQRKGHLKGSVYWQPRGVGAQSSQVEVKTSNSPIKLSV
ncbi:hypothetical protein SERLA73DRAFT_178667 [Serpula lacrymans var. lacrymans S7.3]|uniref:Uncharacterized protein n=2 Tax=Serpula lacrymans var. lacrymans TaxID=341189 RepID=F8PSD7_SERL3|nr:uncharacterized protein SERLADRAFT_463239 [Serpula lacrymans var. lacrymans S7.9]EGO00750.1 hypothetical protein SERLA73DRAFT_178667 [Serpula lacrymans var. lacrymans S7.3]EGO26317.1 hypothetical protein SERLADRAFT_463239 [Serpula lacrymans var. lacrymans S7.9]